MGRVEGVELPRVFIAEDEYIFSGTYGGVQVLESDDTGDADEDTVSGGE